MENYLNRIESTPDIRSGKPCIKGTRISVYDILEYMAGGDSAEEILNNFPNLTQQDILAALAFAAAGDKVFSFNLARSNENFA